MEKVDDSERTPAESPLEDGAGGAGDVDQLCADIPGDAPSIAGGPIDAITGVQNASFQVVALAAPRVEDGDDFTMFGFAC